MTLVLKAHAAICSDFLVNLFTGTTQMRFQKLQAWSPWLLRLSYVPGWSPVVIVSHVWCDTEAVPPQAITPLVIVGSAIWMSARHCIISSLVAWHKLFSMVGPIVAAFEVDHLSLVTLAYWFISRGLCCDGSLINATGIFILHRILLQLNCICSECGCAIENAAMWFAAYHSINGFIFRRYKARK